jgi:predicted FMN-binding regulatory protein PaiB
MVAISVASTFLREGCEDINYTCKRCDAQMRRRVKPALDDLAAGNEALMIFQGPEGYITPNWYPSKTDHGKVVPTWNYAVVHAYGRPEVMQDKDWIRRHVTELTAQQEATEAKPWALSDAPESFIEVMLRGIVGFRFAITRLEGKWKMSQNRDMGDRNGVVQGLGKRGRGDDLELAEIVLGQGAPRQLTNSPVYVEPCPSALPPL